MTEYACVLYVIIPDHIRRSNWLYFRDGDDGPFVMCLDSQPRNFNLSGLNVRMAEGIVLKSHHQSWAQNWGRNGYVDALAQQGNGHALV